MVTKYVSKTATGTNSGASWANAWTELSSITGLAAGDVVEIDGGAASMEYTTTLTLNASGSAGLPITYRRSAEPGRNGQVRIFGGRSVLLPNSDQASFTDDAGPFLAQAISVPTGRTQVIVDGGRWSGVYIHGAQHAIRMDGNPSRIAFRGIEAYNCGTVVGTGPYNPDGKAIQTAGSNIWVDGCLLHDCGQDLMQNDFDSGLHTLVARRSAFYTTREHPSWGGWGFNNSTHSDGLQIFNSNVSSGGSHPHGPLLFLDCILGPGVSQGIVGGDIGNSAIVNDVTCFGCLFANLTNHNGPLINSTVDGDNYRLERCTHLITPQRVSGEFDPGYTPNWRHMSMSVGTGHVVKDCIFQRGRTFTSGGTLATNTGNVLDGVTNQGGTAIAGTAADPDFRTPTSGWTATQSLASVHAADFTPRAAAAAGKGPRITSHAMLRRTGAFANYVRSLRPKSLWTLADPPGRTTLLDDMLAQDGTLVGSAVLGVDGSVRDDPWTAMQLDQADAQQVSVGDTYHFASTAAFSFGLRLRLDEIPGGAFVHRLIYAGYTSGTEQGWTAMVNNTSPTITAQRILNGSANTLTGVTPLVVGRWTDYLLTYDGTTMRQYLDGRLDASVASANSLLDGARTTYLFSSNFSNSRPKGAFQMCAIWDRALSAAEAFKLSHLARVGDRTGQDSLMGMAA